MFAPPPLRIAGFTAGTSTTYSTFDRYCNAVSAGTAGCSFSGAPGKGGVSICPRIVFNDKSLSHKAAGHLKFLSENDLNTVPIRPFKKSDTLLVDCLSHLK